jgi:hypothetical protein
MGIRRYPKPFRLTHAGGASQAPVPLRSKYRGEHSSGRSINAAWLLCTKLNHSPVGMFIHFAFKY